MCSTSPSIYMKVVEMSVTDGVGPVGPTNGFPILAFTPGELSTFYGDGRLFMTQSARPFNEADLPCPPMSVMVSFCEGTFSSIVTHNDIAGKLV